MGTQQTRDALTDVLTAPLSAVGLDLEAVELAPAGRRRLLRVAVDKDGGVTVDDLAEATREVSRVLDAGDVMGDQPYVLEVSSRGTDRPLTQQRHWRRNRGRLVAVTLTDGGRVTGRIVDAPEGSVLLDVDGAPRELALAVVARAVIQVELNRPGRDEPEEEED